MTRRWLGGPARIASSERPPAYPPSSITRPCESATADDFDTACGSEPICVTPSRNGFVGCLLEVVVLGLFLAAPLPQAAASSAVATRAAEALATQADLADDAGSLLVGHPARLDRPVGTARKPAGPREARPADARHAPAADVAARQVFELERRRLEPPRRDEEVGAHEELLWPWRLPDEGDDLLHLRAVADHTARERFVHLGSIPGRRGMAERSDDEQGQRDEGHGARNADPRRPEHVAAESPD